MPREAVVSLSSAKEVKGPGTAFAADGWRGRKRTIKTRRKEGPAESGLVLLLSNYSAFAPATVRRGKSSGRTQILAGVSFSV
jgi:hypothetical protein